MTEVKPYSLEQLFPVEASKLTPAMDPAKERAKAIKAELIQEGLKALNQGIAHMKKEEAKAEAELKKAITGE